MTVEAITATEGNDTTVPTIEEKYFDYSNTVMNEDFSQSIQHHFSDTQSKDTFTLSFPKGNINNTETTLKIVKANGELILEKKFKTRELINGYDLREITNDIQMETYIIDKAKNVVSNDSFEVIGKDEPFIETDKEEYENYDVYLECKKEHRPLFSLHLGEEDTTQMGYSVKLQKVIDVLYCC